jgi:hypothetical protein
MRTVIIRKDRRRCRVGATEGDRTENFDGQESAISDASATFQRTNNIAKISEGHVAFFGHNSWYRVPPHLEKIPRAAQETHFEVKFTTDRDCTYMRSNFCPHRLRTQCAIDLAYGGALAARLRRI